MQTDYLETNGIRLHYLTEGEGSLLLFLHGFPEFCYSWRYQLPAFSRNYKAVALDLRGYNNSEKPKEKSAYALSELVNDVRGTLQALGYDQCVLIGHDWGGAISWSFAEVYPELVHKLIVLNLPHPARFAESLRTPRQLLRSWYIALFQLPCLPELILRAGNYAAIRKAFTSQVICSNAFTEDDLDAFVNAAAKPGALTSMVNYYRNLFQVGGLLNRKWGVIKVPTLMIWGEKDLALGKELTYGTDRYVADLMIRYIPNCSHWVQQEKPEVVNQYIQEFLE